MFFIYNFEVYLKRYAKSTLAVIFRVIKRTETSNKVSAQYLLMVVSKCAIV